MSRSINKAILIGNLGADPEVRTTGGGTKVAEFSLATSRRWNDRNGQQQEKTEWHKIIGWAALADIAEQYLKKGDKVFIEGEIQYRSYEDKEGNTRYVTEINAKEMIMLGGRDGGSGGGGGFQSRSKQPAAAGRQAVKEGEQKDPTYDGFPAEFPEDDDLPF